MTRGPRCMAHACKCAGSGPLWLCGRHSSRLPAPLIGAISTRDGPELQAQKSFIYGLLALAEFGPVVAAAYGARARRWRLYCQKWRRVDPLAGLTQWRLKPAPAVQTELC